MMLRKTSPELSAEYSKFSLPDSVNEIWQPPFEWLETNGLGGWSSSTLIGCHSRRYHGLLVAATHPPTERMNLVSKLDEAIVFENEKIELGCNLYNNVLSPRGYKYLSSFQKDIFPEWVYEFKGIQLKKTLAMIHGENTVVIIYQVLQSPAPFHLELLPLISAKGYHALQHASPALWWDAQFENGVFHHLPLEGAPDIFISVPNASFQPNPCWYYQFSYIVDKYRGQEFQEDLFNHGTFSIPLQKGDSIGIILSVNNPTGRNPHELVEKEKQRRLSLLVRKGNSFLPAADLSIRQQLLLAADQFIVQREEDLKTVIAGYHWFTDWGRDTMISLPGLCLCTGRLEDAKKILTAFANSVSMGMLPNRFQDNNEPPEYNNVDGTLWYFIAVIKYLRASGNTDYVITEILPVLKEIINWHFSGTRYHIHVTEDLLLFAGENGQQLTWMDARIDSWVVTPRMGQPVEIQALWYNALKIYAELLQLNQEVQEAETITACASKAKESFQEKYWCSSKNYLYDNIDEQGNSDASLRPNQLFALGLVYPIFDDAEKTQFILKVIEDKLLTPVGLRSLSPDDERYIPQYGGDVFHRDAAYHQGTVWSWLLGPYVDAKMKQRGMDIQNPLPNLMEGIRAHLNEGAVGSVSEIFDGQKPHAPRGCIAQAWGVAEWLRIFCEYGLE